MTCHDVDAVGGHLPVILTSVLSDQAPKNLIEFRF